MRGRNVVTIASIVGAGTTVHSCLHSSLAPRSAQIKAPGCHGKLTRFWPGLTVSKFHTLIAELALLQNQRQYAIAGFIARLFY